MEMFKAILREALQSKCIKVSLTEGKLVIFESAQGENQRPAYGPIKGQWLKELFKALFPKNFHQIEAGETCVGGFSLQGIGKVSMIARTKPEVSIWLFMPPDGEVRCKDFWDKLHEKPPAPKPPSPPPPPPMPSASLPTPGANPGVKPDASPPTGGMPGSSIPFAGAQLPVGGDDLQGAASSEVPSAKQDTGDGFSLQGTEYLNKQNNDQPESNLGFKSLSRGGPSDLDGFNPSAPSHGLNDPGMPGGSKDLGMGDGGFSSAGIGGDFSSSEPSGEVGEPPEAGGFTYNSNDMFGSTLAKAEEDLNSSQQDLFSSAPPSPISQGSEDPFSQKDPEDPPSSPAGYSMDQDFGSHELDTQVQSQGEAEQLHMKQSVNTLEEPGAASGLGSHGEQSIPHQPNYAPVAAVAAAPQPEKVLEVDFSNEVPGTISKGDGNNPIDQILRGMIENRASDLHLTIGQPVIFRIDGDICRAKTPNLSSETMKSYVLPIMPQVKQQQFAKTWDVDFAYEVSDLGRFRVNVFRDYHGVGSVMRHIPDKVLTADQLNLPDSIRKLCKLSKGLVLVTGPTGSGKSTTLAAMIDLINSNRSEHILTIEDPIEFVHQQKKCLVNQREVGKHTNSFSTALKAALREDPDIVLVGELRDLETTAIALETAETGHLVFGTLHTNTAISTVDRIIDQFPADQQRIIRNMLASSMKGVIAQSLCKKKQGGRCASYEILIPNDAVGSMIRESKNHMISNHMQTQQADGNCLMAESLARLVVEDQVDYWEAWSKAVDKKEFEEYAKRKRISIPPPP